MAALRGVRSSASDALSGRQEDQIGDFNSNMSTDMMIYIPGKQSRLLHHRWFLKLKAQWMRRGGGFLLKSVIKFAD